MTKNNKKYIQEYYLLIKDKPDFRVKFRSYLSFFKEYQRKDKLAEKQKRFEQYRSCEENGYVVLIEQGMSCDGGQYRFVGGKIKCVPTLIEKEIDDIHYWADGHCGVRVVSPSEAKKIEDVVVDRQMEAYENGHMHLYRMGAI